MTTQIPPHRRTIIFSMLLGALLSVGCDENKEKAPSAEPSAAAAPEPAPLPAGWEQLEVQVQGHAVSTLAPTEEQEVEASERGTSIYGTLPDQSYPYYFSLRHHDEAPALRDILNKAGLEKEDTDYGFHAELRAKDGKGWSYVVYNDAQKLSCKVSLSASKGVSDELIEEARRPCDRLAK